jgi:beta-barrel assembly-enhancing protease
VTARLYIIIPRIVVFMLLGLRIVFCSCSYAADSTVPTKPQVKQKPSEEDRLGEKAAAELEKQIKIDPNSPELPRLARIAGELVPFTERPGVSYTIKVLISPAVNAVSLPGGRIYVTQGILEAVESDDELAAVLAHEMAHNALGHAMDSKIRNDKSNWGMIVAVLAGIWAGRGEVPMMASQIQQGVLNHYGRKAEAEADMHGLIYLSHSKYHPTAMLTVLEGLAGMEESHWKSDMITTATTHPMARERARVVRAQLVKMGVNIDAERRQVTHRFKIETASVVKDGCTYSQITINGKPVFMPAATDGALSAQQRAQVYADALRESLNQGLQILDLVVTTQGQDVLLSARDKMLLRVTAEDAKLANRSSQDMATDAKKAIEAALYAEKLTRVF